MLNADVFFTRLADIAGTDSIKKDEPMKNHTSMKVGGPADFMVIPETVEILVNIYRYCLDRSIPVFVMGNGTNLIVRDKGIRGVVLKVFDRLQNYEVDGTIISAEAGILLSKLSSLALEAKLEGLEFAEGIPGTLGGAVTMNAGAYTGTMADVVVWTEYLDRAGRICFLEGIQHNFGKRSSVIQENGGIVLRSRLELKKGHYDEIKARMREFNSQRRDKQPLEMPSAGSVFKRPEGYFAGKLVEDCGLRGYRHGGAEVSCKHCGFIVNAQNATAKDITGLIKHIQNEVKGKHQVELQTEVMIIGEE